MVFQYGQPLWQFSSRSDAEWWRNMIESWERGPGHEPPVRRRQDWSPREARDVRRGA